MQNPPKACLEPAGLHAPKGWRGAAKLSAGFGEQRGWRNPSCVVTPQNLRVWGRMRRCAARRGLQGRCPLLRPPLPPPRENSSTQRRGPRCRRRGMAPLSGEGAAPIAGGKGGEGGGDACAAAPRPAPGSAAGAERARVRRRCGQVRAGGTGGGAAPAASRDWPGPARLGPLRGTRPRSPLSVPRF